MGEHSAPTPNSTISTSGTFAAIVAGVSLSVGSALLGTDSALAAVDNSKLLDAIADCESGGDPNVVNASGHGGLFQFDAGTWRSVGGSGRPENASVAEQYKRAALLLASRGTQPWLASKGCWTKKIGSGPKISKATSAPTAITTPTTKKPIPTAKATVKPSPVPRVKSTPIHDSVNTTATASASAHVVVRGDTLSDIATRYKIKGGWETLHKLNSNIVGDPNKIYPGQSLRLKV
jgi:LysM repeat protein